MRFSLATVLALFCLLVAVAAVRAAPVAPPSAENDAAATADALERRGLFERAKGIGQSLKQKGAGLVNKIKSKLPGNSPPMPPYCLYHRSSCSHYYSSYCAKPRFLHSLTQLSRAGGRKHHGHQGHHEGHGHEEAAYAPPESY
ncbi:hypothetical protein DFJ73DRAFT_758989 [Zopfochytrium polystomum]|nr:hypothetical protein DFJ73DRAFT_758989 [Zopfochytrium polystomum]